MFKFVAIMNVILENTGVYYQNVWKFVFNVSCPIFRGKNIIFINEDESSLENIHGIIIRNATPHFSGVPKLLRPSSLERVIKVFLKSIQSRSVNICIGF